MKQATLLILSLVLLGASADPRKLLRKWGIGRDFCDRGQKPIPQPLDRDCESYVGTTIERPEKPEKEDCEVGEEVTKEFCVLCVDRRSKEVISATEYQITGECIDDCKRGKESCFDFRNAECSE